MQRIVLLGAGAVVLAAGLLLVRPAGDHPQAGAQGHASATRGDHALSEEPGFRPEKRPSEPDDPFKSQARQITAMPQDTARENALRDLAQAWGREAPLAAERWARALLDPAERERALTQVCLEVSVQDPREALRIAQANELHSGILQAIAARWAGMDFAAASAWVDDAPAGEVRDRVLLQLIQSRASETPAEAAAMLSQSKLNHDAQEEAAIGIVHQWLLKDPAAAREWVDRFPEGSTKERAMAEIQGAMARQDARGK